MIRPKSDLGPVEVEWFISILQIYHFKLTQKQRKTKIDYHYENLYKYLIIYFIQTALELTFTFPATHIAWARLENTETTQALTFVINPRFFK